MGYHRRNMGGSNKEARREQQKKVQDQLGVLQQMLEATSITKEHRSGEGPSMGPRREVESVQSTLTQLTIGHRTLQIETDALEFPMGELQEKVNALGYLNIVVSRIPMQRLQDLQAHLLQEIKTKGEERSDNFFNVSHNKSH
jgi:hypothetical protein